MSHFTLLQLSLHPLGRDFRRELLRAAARRGDRAIHVECGSQIIAKEIDINGDGKLIAEGFDNISAFANTLNNPNLVVLTGFGSVNTKIGYKISSLFPERQRFYDVIDDLSYGSTGLGYIKFVVRDARWRLHCSKAIVLEQGMQNRYSGSIHLDNASHLTPGGDQQAIRLVYIGSFDDRLDFEMIRAFGSMLPIDIYGRAHPKWPSAFVRLEELAKESSNIRLMAPYDNDELSAILRMYSHGIVPYKTSDRLTSHINPDKIYHYLNSGLGVISSEIPQAERMTKYISIYRKHQPIIDTIKQANTRKIYWQWQDHNWDYRWQYLIASLDLPST